MDNKDIIKKADMALSDLAAGGKLSVIQSDRFIRTLIAAPTILRDCRTVPMNGPEMKINKIGFGSRILRAAVESTPLSSGDRSKPDLGNVPLVTKEVIAEVRLPYAVLEDNIERGNINVGMEQGAGGIHQTIVELMAVRAATDLEELAILGDTGSGDAYLALQNGFLKLANVNIVTAGSPISKDVLKAGVKAMPDPYLANRAALVHYVSTDNETDLRDQYAGRETALGDEKLQGTTPLYMHGSQVRAASLMPGANGLFTNPKNLIFGVQRDITIEYDKDITSRVFIIVLTARVAFAIEEAAAVVKYEGIVT